MPVYCNTTDILNAVLLRIKGNRSKALAYLNEAVQDVLNQPRIWQFLTLPVSAAVVASVASLPAGAAELVWVELGGVHYDKADQITDEEALTGVSGFTLSPAGTITFYPDTNETTCTIKYEVGLFAALTDSGSDTIFQYVFRNCLISGTLLRMYEDDKDGRLTSAVTMFQYQLGLCKAWDNRLEPEVKADGLLKTAAAARGHS